jgi:hypothetical protein
MACTSKILFAFLLSSENCICSGVSVLPHFKYLRTEELVYTAHLAPNRKSINNKQRKKLSGRVSDKNEYQNIL